MLYYNVILVVPGIWSKTLKRLNSYRTEHVTREIDTVHKRLNQIRAKNFKSIFLITWLPRYQNTSEVVFLLIIPPNRLILSMVFLVCTRAYHTQESLATRQASHSSVACQRPKHSKNLRISCKGKGIKSFTAIL